MADRYCPSTLASKRIGLLRHAKSSWSDPGLEDHARPLAPRGRRAASRIGQYIRAEGLEPDLVLCSSAIRARETYDLLELSQTELLVEDEIYGATGFGLLDRLCCVSTTTRSVLLIGHNPAIQEAAISLTSGAAALTGKFPTAALAELLLPDTEEWSELRTRVARLDAFVLPRNLG